MSQLFPNGQPVIREELIQQISEEQLFWDVLVIGGGATQGDFWLVRQASIERGILYRNAPHLVKNQTFIIPVYSYGDMLKYTLGLKMYDWISGKLTFGASVFISRKKIIQSIPGINANGLLGGVLYHDGQFDDSGLAINLAQSILENGGCVINYMKVTGLLKNEHKKIYGVDIEDAESGKQ